MSSYTVVNLRCKLNQTWTTPDLYPSDRREASFQSLSPSRLNLKATTPLREAFKKRTQKVEIFQLRSDFPPLFPEKLKTFFLVFSETRPYKGHFRKKNIFFIPWRSKTLFECFPNSAVQPTMTYDTNRKANDRSCPKFTQNCACKMARRLCLHTPQ